MEWFDWPDLGRVGVMKRRSHTLVVGALITVLLGGAGVAVSAPAWASDDAAAARAPMPGEAAAPESPAVTDGAGAAQPVSSANESALVAAAQAPRLTPRELALKRASRAGPLRSKAYGVVYSREMMRILYGWGPKQHACLVTLWSSESGWRWNARNRRTGAYGIPQALPADKMASVSKDWRTNPRTQILWGLKYIDQRYNSPCKALDTKRRIGWY